MKRLTEAVVVESVEKQLDQREIKKRKKEKDKKDAEVNKKAFDLAVKESAVLCLSVRIIFSCREFIGYFVG